MKRSFLVLILLVASGTFAVAFTPHSTLTFVKSSHHHDKRVQRHRAHKTGKHHTPRHPHHHAV